MQVEIVYVKVSPEELETMYKDLLRAILSLPLRPERRRQEKAQEAEEKITLPPKQK